MLVLLLSKAISWILFVFIICVVILFLYFCYFKAKRSGVIGVSANSGNNMTTTNPTYNALNVDDEEALMLNEGFDNQPFQSTSIANDNN